MSTPDQDQAAAVLRDATRLRQLMAPYVTGPREDFREALPRMPAAEHAEAETLLARVPVEDPDQAEARREALLRYASYEATARATADDETQRPAVRRRARQTLDRITRARDRLAGLRDQPPGEDSAHQEHDHGHA